MEQNLAITTKKMWKIIRVVYFMLRKGISKGKVLADLASLMKRGKIAGKAAIQNLMFQHHPAATRRGAAAYDFMSSPIKNSPLPEIFCSASASPALPGFGPSPMVRQLRITDSPFPLRDSEDSQRVDDAAEEFIIKFYNDLKKQNAFLGYS